MKAIILAAGRGSRMGHLTDDGPKGLLRIGHGTLLERTAEMLRDAGVYDIVVTRGYMADRVIVEDVTYVENVDWSNTEVLHSIFAAREHLQGDLLISYSDIVFTQEVLLTAITSLGEIRPVVDLDWRRAYEGRLWHPLAEADKVVLRRDGTIGQIGKLGIRHEDADGEFIGMLRLSGDGAARLIAAYDASARSPDAPFKRAATFRRAYLTDLLQQMIDDGESLMPTVIRGGWREIDTQEDLERARRWLDAR
jgi:choline kinase